jgi:hypothetical protein
MERWHGRPSLGLVAPTGEYEISASTTSSLMAEVMLSIMAMKKRSAADRGLVMASQARRFTMNWFATTEAGHCDCQDGLGMTRR